MIFSANGVSNCDEIRLILFRKALCLFFQNIVGERFELVGKLDARTGQQLNLFVPLLLLLLQLLCKLEFLLLELFGQSSCFQLRGVACIYVHF